MAKETKREKVIKEKGSIAPMVSKATWEEFKAIGLLWWVNRILHVFGWAIVMDVNVETEAIEGVYPARVKFRGFDASSEEEGHIKLSKYMEENAKELLEEVTGKNREKDNKKTGIKRKRKG